MLTFNRNDRIKVTLFRWHPHALMIGPNNNNVMTKIYIILIFHFIDNDSDTKDFLICLISDFSVCLVLSVFLIV